MVSDLHLAQRVFMYLNDPQLGQISGGRSSGSFHGRSSAFMAYRMAFLQNACTVRPAALGLRAFICSTASQARAYCSSDIKIVFGIVFIRCSIARNKSKSMEGQSHEE